MARAAAGLAALASRPWVWGLAAYLVFVVPAAYLRRDALEPDAVSYLRHALYLAQGRLADSVSGYWSPLLSWSVAPFLLLGLDSLWAARLVLAGWGLLPLLAGISLIRRLAPLAPRALQAAAAVVLAAGVSQFATYVTGPDLLLGGWLLLYCRLVLDPRLLASPRRAAGCGLIGGAAYLAKAIGLPYFLLHFSAVVLARRLAGRGGHPAGAAPPRALAAWLAGLAGCFALALPWIAVLSLKYRRPTWSTAASINRAIIGPGDQRRNHPSTYTLCNPPPGRICAQEARETYPYNSWSPFASRRYFLHQLEFSRSNAARMVKALNRFDRLSLILPALILLLLAAHLGRGYGRRALGTEIFLAGTALLYFLPFLLVTFVARYFYPFLWPLGLVAALRAAGLPAAASSGAWRRGLAAALAALAVLSFGATGLPPAARLAAAGAGDFWRGAPPAQPFREAARRLRAAGLAGPVAATDWRRALYFCYHLELPFLGPPEGQTVGEVEAELRAHGARSFLVAANWPLRDAFAREGSWRAAGGVLVAARRDLFAGQMTDDGWRSEPPRPVAVAQFLYLAPEDGR